MFRHGVNAGDTVEREYKRTRRMVIVATIVKWLAFGVFGYIVITNLSDISAGVGGAIGSGVKAYQEASQ
jgi:hypothetical protein